MFLFAAQGKHPELIKLLLLTDSKKAFVDEIRDEQEGEFLRQLDYSLHAAQFIRSIKHWNRIPDEEAKTFFGMYKQLTTAVASPVQLSQMRSLKGLENNLSEVRIDLDKNFNHVQHGLAQIIACGIFQHYFRIRKYAQANRYICIRKKEP